jgi:hypothetical protein
VPFADGRQARLDCKTQVKQLFIKGKTVDLDNKHKRLYEKYLKRP